MLSLLQKLRPWAKRLRTDILSIYFAARDPRTPWAVRLLALAVAAYALSPIDLIPDFIPVLGDRDDVLIVPLGLWLLLRAIPPAVLADARARAAAQVAKPRSWLAAVCIVVLWLVLAFAFLRAW